MLGSRARATRLRRPQAAEHAAHRVAEFFDFDRCDRCGWSGRFVKFNETARAARSALALLRGITPPIAIPIFKDSPMPSARAVASAPRDRAAIWRSRPAPNRASERAGGPGAKPPDQKRRGLNPCVEAPAR